MTLELLNKLTYSSAHKFRFGHNRVELYSIVNGLPCSSSYTFEEIIGLTRNK